MKKSVGIISLIAIAAYLILVFSILVNNKSPLIHDSNIFNLAIISSIYISGALCFLFTFYFAGSLPKSLTEIPLRQAVQVYLSTGNRFSYFGGFAALTLTQTGFSIYIFRRQVLHLAPGDSDRIRLREKRGKHFLEITENRSIYRVWVPEAPAWYQDLYNLPSPRPIT